MKKDKEKLKNEIPMDEKEEKVSKEFISETEPETEKKSNFFVKGVKTVGRWCKRTFLGGSKELSKEKAFKVDEIISPGKQLVKNFFSKKLACGAVIIFIVLFLFVFIGSACLPMDLNYSENRQANLAPGYSQMAVPKKISSQLKSVSTYSNFSVGVGRDGALGVWGNGVIGATKINIKKIPAEVKNAKIKFAAAGNDHIIAIDENGSVYGWGVSTNKQYGDASMPKQVDVENVQELVCGYQISSIIMKDGSVYVWGNERNTTNLTNIAKLTNVEKIIYTRDKAIVLNSDGEITLGRVRNDGTQNYESFSRMYPASDTVSGESIETAEFLKDWEVYDIAATSTSLHVLGRNKTSGENKIFYSGTIAYKENILPKLNEGEYFVKISAGATHVAGITNKGRVLSWGNSAFGLNKPTGKTFDPEKTELYSGAYQNYIYNSDSGKLQAKWGLKGYLMGTDEQGRDVFARVIHGGRMTLTVGAVAVIISSIIGVIIGCLSGYFGGVVDMVLMRITEIVSAIPFLPFAMILSLILNTSPIGELGRIIIIMVILGVLSWTPLARLVRGQVLAEREKEFVLAAKAMGVKEWKIAFRHILPNVISVIIVSMTLDFAGCMLTESSLSYLGFGVKAPRPTWGNMLNGCLNSIVIQTYWWRWLFPSLFLAIATICINIIGDAIRDVMDPKSSVER